MNAFFAIAAALSAAVCTAHVVAGGKFYVRPLLAATGLHPVPRYVHYYCWHIVTMMLAATAVGFGRAAVDPAAADVALLLTVLSTSFSAWSLALVLWKRQRLFQMPQWALFAPVSIFGILGLTAGAPG